MTQSLKSWICCILTALCLVGIAFAVPSGAVLPEAQLEYMENMPLEFDEDEYAFLFEDEE